MSKPVVLFVSLLLSCVSVHAEVYKCVGSGGHVTYTNERTSRNGCAVLSENQPVTSFPRIRAETPSDFPRVTADQQKSRDGTRLQILEGELASEEAALKTAQAELDGARGAGGNTATVKAAQDRLELHERNVEALKKEMGALR